MERRQPPETNGHDPWLYGPQEKRSCHPTLCRADVRGNSQDHQKSGGRSTSKTVQQHTPTAGTSQRQGHARGQVGSSLPHQMRGLFSIVCGRDGEATQNKGQGTSQDQVIPPLWTSDKGRPLLLQRAGIFSAAGTWLVQERRGGGHPHPAWVPLPQPRSGEAQTPGYLPGATFFPVTWSFTSAITWPFLAQDSLRALLRAHDDVMSRVSTIHLLWRCVVEMTWKLSTFLNLLPVINV